jgi:parallel beta-helix repeat protein
MVIKVENVVISGFTILNTETEYSAGGISISSNHTTIIDNIIDVYYSNSINFRGLQDIEIINNEISTKIWIESSKNILISGNTINSISVSTGLVLRYVKNSNIYYNNFFNGKWGLELGYSRSNIITNNNFVGNEKHVTQSVLCKNFFDDNYWENWIGNRIKIPLFQLFPYVIFSGSLLIDWHPAKEPYDI